MQQYKPLRNACWSFLFVKASQHLCHDVWSVFSSFLSFRLKPHPPPASKFLPLFYTEHFLYLSSCACLNWKRRNWREMSGFREVGVGGILPICFVGAWVSWGWSNRGKGAGLELSTPKPIISRRPQQQEALGCTNDDRTRERQVKHEDMLNEMVHGHLSVNHTTQLVALVFSVAQFGNDFGLRV